MAALDGEGPEEDAAEAVPAQKPSDDWKNAEEEQEKRKNTTEEEKVEKKSNDDDGDGIDGDDDNDEKLATTTTTTSPAATDAARFRLDASPEALDAASSLKAEGNDAFGRGEFERAVEAYWEALEKLGDEREVGGEEEEEEEEQEERGNATELGATLHANLAAAFLKLGDFGEARESADAALRLLVEGKRKKRKKKKGKKGKEGGEEEEEEEGNSSCFSRRLRVLRAKALLRRAAALAGEGDLVSAAADARGAEREASAVPSASSSSSSSSSSSAAAAASAAQPSPPHHHHHKHDQQLCQLASQASAAALDYDARAAADAERAKEEVVGKLKELGNSLLGRFGLSLDNFAAEKDPETGAYSIKFNQGGGSGGGGGGGGGGAGTAGDAASAVPLGRSGVGGGGG